jgi:hypothetical protein
MTAPRKKKMSFLLWGLCPQTPGIFRDPAIPGCQIKTKRGGYRRHRPGLAPESALRLHPCRALSSAPVSTSVGHQRRQTKLVIVVVGKNNCR